MPTSPPTLRAALQDYTPPPYLIDSVHLNFLLGDTVTRVESCMQVLPNHAASERPPLFLHGCEGERLTPAPLWEPPPLADAAFRTRGVATISGERAASPGGLPLALFPRLPWCRFKAG